MVHMLTVDEDLAVVWEAFWVEWLEWAEPYRVLPVMRILLGSMTRQASPAVWMVRRAELSCTMYAQIRDSGSRPACCRGGGGSCCPTERERERERNTGAHTKPL